jgi:pyrrolysine biosynthesis protein PylC
MVQLLGELFLQGSVKFDRSATSPLGVVFEHIKISPPLMQIAGEHVMTEGGPLHICRDFFGADEAITNYRSGRREWVATLIISGRDRQEAWARRCQVVAGIQQRFRLDACLDPSPEGPAARPARNREAL